MDAKTKKNQVGRSPDVQNQQTALNEYLKLYPSALEEYKTAMADLKRKITTSKPNMDNYRTPEAIEEADKRYVSTVGDAFDKAYEALLHCLEATDLEQPIQAEFEQLRKRIQDERRNADELKQVTTAIDSYLRRQNKLREALAEKISEQFCAGLRELGLEVSVISSIDEHDEFLDESATLFVKDMGLNLGETVMDAQDLVRKLTEEQKWLLNSNRSNVKKVTEIAEAFESLKNAILNLSKYSEKRAVQSLTTILQSNVTAISSIFGKMAKIEHTLQQLGLVRSSHFTSASLECNNSLTVDRYMRTDEHNFMTKVSDICAAIQGYTLESATLRGEYSHLVNRATHLLDS